MKKILLLLCMTFIGVAIHAQSISIENIKLIYDQYRNGVKGMILRTTFVVNGMKGRSLLTGGVLFYRNTDAPVMVNGNRLASTQILTPAYESTRYSNYDYFFAYSSFPNISGKQDMYVRFAVTENRTPFQDIGRSQPLYFTFTSSGNNNQPFYVPFMPPVSSGGYGNSSGGMCPVCHGTGLMEKYNPNGGTYNFFCRICNRSVPGGHYHVTCTTCGGDGQL